MASRVIFMATSWGARNGGVNAFNLDLACSLAAVLAPGFRVTCVVPQASSEEVRLAADRSVDLVGLKPSDIKDRFEGNRVDEIVNTIRESPYPDVAWWVGHDLITGPIAAEGRAALGGRLAVIHHMDYDAYSAIKETDEAAARAKSRAQRELMASADVVMAVGPKLARSAADKLGGREVVEIVPGLAKVAGTAKPPQTFSALTFGRLDPRNDRVKLASLAVAAFARAAGSDLEGFGKDARLTVIGLSEDDYADEHKSLMAIAEEESGEVVAVNGWPYDDDRPALLEELRIRSACMMLSWHEGFGLAGWEAIAAEVPLVVSKNSGVYETIHNYLGGSGTGCVHGVRIRGATGDRPYRAVDVETVKEALRHIRANETRCKLDAQLLKRTLARICTWEHAAAAFADACGLPAKKARADVNVERWQGDLLVSALFDDAADLIDEVTLREKQIERIWEKMRPPSTVHDRILVFGGVSSALVSTEAAKRYAAWLASNPAAKLYLCYETGSALYERAKRLDEGSLPNDGDLPSEPTKRMMEKEGHVLELGRMVEEELAESTDALARFHLVPLTEAPTTYVIMADDDTTIGLVFHKRSSETFSVTLSPGAVQFRQDVQAYVLHHLRSVEQTAVTEELVRELAAEGWGE